MIMQYALQAIDDDETNIFEGLLSLTQSEIALPSDWIDDFQEESTDSFSRETLNARMDFEVECWECRLA